MKLNLFYLVALSFAVVAVISLISLGAPLTGQPVQNSKESRLQISTGVSSNYTIRWTNSSPNPILTISNMQYLLFPTGDIIVRVSDSEWDYLKGVYSAYLKTNTTTFFE